MCYHNGMSKNTSDVVLLWVTRGVLFLVPFVPLIITSSLFFPFITGKGFAFRIIVEIIFACWLLLALRDARFRPKESWLLWGVLVFLGVVLLADSLAVNPFKAFLSNFERMEGFITLIHLGAYFLVASSVFDTEKWWHRFFATSVGVSAFLGIYGILQLAGKIVINQGGVRLDGTFGNAAYFAGYMLFHIFLTLFLILRHRIPFQFKWLYGGALFLQVFTLVFTATRGAGLGLIGGLSVFLLLVAIWGAKENKKMRNGALIAFAVVYLFAGGLYVLRDATFIKGNPALTRFASISRSDAGPRLMVWGMAWQGFKEHPILGWGQEGFNHVFNKYYNPDMWTQEQWFDRTHDIFFDWLISAGLLGLFAYLSLFAGLLWFIWRGKRTDGEMPFSFAERSVLTGLLVAYVIHNFFVFDNLISYILFFSFIAFIHSRFSSPFSRFEQLPRLQSEQSMFTVGTLLLILVTSSIYVLNIRAINVSLNLIQGLRPQDKGVTENLALYKKAFAIETIGSQEVAEQSMQTAITVANATGVPTDIKNQFIDFAILAMNREIERVPTDTRLRMFIGGFYNRLGRYTDALPQLEKALLTSPNKQTVAFELSGAYLSLGKQAEAVTVLKRAFESAPKFTAARIAYATSVVYAKNFALADELLAGATDTHALTDERLIRAYYEMKQYGKVVSLLKLRLTENPDDPQTHISLAAVQFSNGNRTEAIKELQRAIELNPGFKAQGQHYIDEIKAGRTP